MGFPGRVAVCSCGNNAALSFVVVVKIGTCAAVRAKFATGLERRVHRHLGLLELRHPLADLRRPEAADPFLARFQHEVGRGLGALEHGVGDLDLVQVLARLGVVVLVPKEKGKRKKETNERVRIREAKGVCASPPCHRTPLH